jgi:hypothetical protein
MGTNLMRKTIYALALVSMIAAVTADAQLMQTTMTQQEGVANQTLRHRFMKFDDSVVGSLQYNGGGGVGAKFFGFFNFSADYLGFFSTTGPIVFGPDTATRILKVESTGVTVGTNPADTGIRLTVNGAIDVKGNIAAKYQDVAEWVPSFGNPTPGTVVILSQDATNHVVASATPYDTRVAGVVSEQPGVILGEPGANKVQVATTGRVRVRVDATAGAIKIGDLLVTSDKPGVAMKSMPVEIAGIQMHRPGTVVGKALEPLAGGVGEILVLLSLQ